MEGPTYVFAIEIQENFRARAHLAVISLIRVIQKIQTFQTVDITIKNNKILFFRAKLIQMCKNFSKIFIFRYCYFTSKFLEESLSKMTHFQQPDEVEKLIWSFF